MLEKEIRAVLAENPHVLEAVAADLVVSYERNPAYPNYLVPYLFAKGFLGLQVHRVAHEMWHSGRVMAASFLQMPAQIVMGAFYGLYIIMFIALIDAVFLGFRVRKKAQERFGESARKGAVMYVVMRAFQIRRTRLPKPQNKRGEFPT